MMRWTIRGVSNDTADAVREVASETGSTLGEVIRLCVHHGLPETSRQLAAECATESAAILAEINRITGVIRDAFALRPAE